MIEQIAHRITPRRNLALFSAALILGIAPAISSAQFMPMTSTPDPKGVTSPVPSATFDVTSVKLQKPSADGSTMTMVKFPPNGRFTGAGNTLKNLICIAYGISDFQVTGGPDWIDSTRFDVEATPDSALQEQLPKMTSDQATLVKHQMMQALLADRFKLTLHHDTKELPVYSLVLAKGGPKLTESKPDDANPDTANAPGHPPRKGMMRMSFDSKGVELTSTGMSMDGLARQLAFQLHSTVQDHTGLTGSYEFTLHFTPDDARSGIPEAGGGGGASDNAGISVFAAVQDQLGLKLESKKGPVDVVVVDHVDKPSDN